MTPAPAPTATDLATAPRSDPIDWGIAERVARRVSGRDPLSGSYLSGSLADDFEDVTREAERLVTEHTGLRVPDPAHAEVVDRTAWVAANIASMRALLRPLTQRMGDRLGNSPFAPIARRVTGTETGFLLGYLSQRVLGQYDLLVPEGSATDAVYYVGGNILTLEKRYAFRPRDFRLWVAIHEVTHRAQFVGVPWLKGHFLSLLEESLQMVDPDPRRIVQALARAAEELRAGRNPLDDGGLVALLATPEQRVVLGRVQALMSLLEGHGNRVMNEVGAAHVVGQARMARVLQARRQSRGLSGLLHKVVGLESKLRQYDLGESFLVAIEREAGTTALDPAWRAPDNLPTLEELEHPTDWLARVDGR